MKKDNTTSKFIDIMESEAHFLPGLDIALIERADEFLDITSQILEVGYSASVPRSYITRYGMTDTPQTYESVSAHTMLLQTIVDRALIFRYGSEFKRTVDGFKYREIMEAARRHDLPEIITGDQPDNGDRDDLGLAKKELSYWNFFAELSPRSEHYFERKVDFLLRDMQRGRSSATGRTLYTADKASAIIIALCCDFRKTRQPPPVMRIDSPEASARERKAMQICSQENGFVRASELWTVDFFKTRELHKYDDSGFFTALIVMATLAAHNNNWYTWREQDYQ